MSFVPLVSMVPLTSLSFVSLSFLVSLQQFLLFDWLHICIMGVDTIYNVGGLNDHCAQSAWKFFALLLKMALLRRNFYQFGRVKLQF